MVIEISIGSKQTIVEILTMLMQCGFRGEGLIYVNFLKKYNFLQGCGC